LLPEIEQVGVARLALDSAYMHRRLGPKQLGDLAAQLRQITRHGVSVAPHVLHFVGQDGLVLAAALRVFPVQVDRQRLEADLNLDHHRPDAEAAM
jgi:hypothetical protein